MADDDIDEQFRRLVADIDPVPIEPLPKPSRASLREVKREAKVRAKAAKQPPKPVEPHRAYLAEPLRKPARVRSERVRAIAIGTVVVVVMGALIYRQWFGGPSDPGVAAPSAAASSAVPTPGVDEADAPLGTPPKVQDEPGRYAFIETQAGSTSPVAFDPCRPIHYVVRTAHAPTQAGRLVSSALATLTAATGLRFVSDGATDEVPVAERAPYQPARYGDRWAPLLLAWATEDEEPVLSDGVIGVARSYPTGVSGGPRVLVTGSVALETAWFEQQLRTTKGSAEAEAVVLHELGHVLGLDHVADKSQIMFEMERPQVTAYGVGDLAGLARLGAGACEPRV